MTPKSIERALARYRAYKDEDVRSRLSLFGPLMLKAAELANTMGEDDVKVLREPSDAEILEAGRGGETLLSRGFVAINPESFAKNLALMGETLLASLKGDEAFNAAARAFDWAPFASEAFVSRAAKSPLEALAAAETMTRGVNAQLLDMWVLPVLGMTLRAYLDAFGTAVSRRLLNLEVDAASWDRRTTCFVCGAEPDVAAVASTPKNGNVKRLYCGCCGAFWTFERIRCARCGDAVMSELSYVSDAQDDTHRLHVCASCHAAMPTLFAAGDELTFNADVEAIVLTGLEEAYGQALAEGTVPGKVMKAGDATMAGRGPGKGLH